MVNGRRAEVLFAPTLRRRLENTQGPASPPQGLLYLVRFWFFFKNVFY